MVGDERQRPLSDDFPAMCGTRKDFALTTPENDQPTAPAIPTADPMLAAVAVLEKFSAGDHASLDALLDTMDPRELSAGLVDVSQFLISMLGRATGGTPAEVLQHLRTTILNLVNDGSFGTGEFPLPPA